MDPVAFMSAYIFYCILNNIWPKEQHTYSILDVGSFDVNGNLRDVLKMSTFSLQRNYYYIGIDRSAGPNVDLIYENDWPLASESFDVVVSSSCFEHDDFFWETFLLLSRTVKPGGFIYISVPSTGYYHGYPVDNWRFYNDSAVALTKWAKKNKEDLVLIHTSTLPHNDADAFLAFGMTNMVFMKQSTPGANSAHMDVSAYSKAFANYKYDVILASNRYLNLYHSLPTYEMLFPMSGLDQRDYETRVEFLYRTLQCGAATEPSLTCASVLQSDQFAYEGMYPSDAFLRNILGYFVPLPIRRFHPNADADGTYNQSQSVDDFGEQLRSKYSNGYPLEYQSIENANTLILSVVHGANTYPIKVIVPLSMRGQSSEIEEYAKRICAEFLAADTRDDYVLAIRNGITAALES